LRMQSITWKDIKTFEQLHDFLEHATVQVGRFGGRKISYGKIAVSLNQIVRKLEQLVHKDPENIEAIECAMHQIIKHDITPVKETPWLWFLRRIAPPKNRAKKLMKLLHHPRSNFAVTNQVHLGARLELLHVVKKHFDHILEEDFSIRARHQLLQLFFDEHLPLDHEFLSTVTHTLISQRESEGFLAGCQGMIRFVESLVTSSHDRAKQAGCHVLGIVYQNILREEPLRRRGANLDRFMELLSFKVLPPMLQNVAKIMKRIKKLRVLSPSLHSLFAADLLDDKKAQLLIKKQLTETIAIADRFDFKAFRGLRFGSSPENDLAALREIKKRKAEGHGWDSFCFCCEKLLRVTSEEEAVKLLDAALVKEELLDFVKFLDSLLRRTSEGVDKQTIFVLRDMLPEGLAETDQQEFFNRLLLQKDREDLPKLPLRLSDGEPSRQQFLASLIAQHAEQDRSFATKASSLIPRNMSTYIARNVLAEYIDRIPDEDLQLLLSVPWNHTVTLHEFKKVMKLCSKRGLQQLFRKLEEMNRNLLGSSYSPLKSWVWAIERQKKAEKIIKQLEIKGNEADVAHGKEFLSGLPLGVLSSEQIARELQHYLKKHAEKFSIMGALIDALNKELLWTVMVPQQ